MTSKNNTRREKNTLNDKIERGRVILLLTVASEVNSWCQVKVLVSGVCSHEARRVVARKCQTGNRSNMGPISDQVGPLLRVYKTVE